jgi:hypothetical protein
MKSILLLLTSSFVIAASGALAQGNSDACHNQYGSCQERCATRPQSMQESCSNSCEAATNQCYSQMYGPGAAQGAQVTTAPSQEPEARDARDEETKPKKTKKSKKD